MWGFTLFPRKTFLIIFLVVMSMNPMSFESRLTIITTFVGSGTRTPCASTVALAAAAATPAARSEPRMMRRALCNMMNAPGSERGLQPDARQQIAELLAARRFFERVRQIERQPQTLGEE